MRPPAAALLRGAITYRWNDYLYLNHAALVACILTSSLQSAYPPDESRLHHFSKISSSVGGAKHFIQKMVWAQLLALLKYQIFLDIFPVQEREWHTSGKASKWKIWNANNTFSPYRRSLVLQHMGNDSACLSWISRTGLQDTGLRLNDNEKVRNLGWFSSKDGFCLLALLKVAHLRTFAKRSPIRLAAHFWRN